MKKICIEKQYITRHIVMGAYTNKNYLDNMSYYKPFMYLLNSEILTKINYIFAIVMIIIIKTMFI